MKTILLIIISFCSICFAQSQFQRGIGGTGDDRAYSIIQTTDGGYALAGYSNSFRAWSDFYVVKLDSSGSLQWTKAVEAGTNNSLQAYSIIRTTDGGYAMAGNIYIYSGGTYYDMFIVKLNSSGSLQWAKAVNGTYGDYASSIIQTTDGGYAVAGSTIAYGMWSDIYIVKLDASGNLLWSKTVGGTNSDGASSIIQTTDGGYAIAGYTHSYGAGSYDFYIVKLDASGTLQWNKAIGGNNEDRAYSIIQTSDGSYAAAGYTQSFGAGVTNMYIVKLNSSGSLLWTRTLGATTIAFYAYSVVQTSDGGYGLTGGVGWNNFNIAKLDASGIVQWWRTVSGTRGVGANSIIQTTDGGYAIGGVTTTDTSGNVGEMLIVKFDTNGTTCSGMSTPSGLMGFGSGIVSTPAPTVSSPASTVTTPPVTVISGGTLTPICLTGIQPVPQDRIPEQFSLFQNYPNPFNPVTKIRFEIPVPLNKGGERGLSVQLVIYDALGKEAAVLVSENLHPRTYEVEWNGTYYPSGVYFYRIEAGNFVEVKKMVLIK